VKQIFSVVFLMGCLLTPSILHAQSQPADTMAKGVADLYQKARKQFYDDQFNKARPLLEAIINNAPDHPLTQNAYYLLGLGLKQKNKEPLKAIDYLYRVYEDYDRSNLTDDVLFHLAEIYVEQLNQPRQAVPYLKIIKEDFQEGDFYTPAVDLFNKLVDSDKLDPENVDVTEKPTPGYTLEFKDLTLKQFIEVYASLTGRNIVYDPNVSGEVNIVGGEPVPVDQFFDVFVNILETHGYSVVQREGIYYVEPIREAMQKGVSTGDEESGLRTELIRIGQLPEDDVRLILESILPSESRHVILQKIGLILVTSKPTKLQEIKGVLVTLKAMEKPAEQQEYFLYRPHYLSSGNLASKLKQTLKGTMDKQNYKVISLDTSNHLLVAIPRSNLTFAKRMIERLDRDLVDRLKVKVIRLKHTDEQKIADKVKNLLRVLQGDFVGKNVRIMADERQNAIVVSSVSDKVFSIVRRLVGELDKKQGEKPDDVKVYRLEHASVDEAVNVLNDVIQIFLGDIPGDNLSDDISITPNKRQKAIFVSARSKKVFPVLDRVIKEIDQPSVMAPNNHHVYNVKNSDAEPLAEKLQTLFEEQGNESAQIDVVADAQTNSLIITAPPDVYERMLGMLQILDTRKQQVLVDVFIAEASTDKVHRLGVEWGAEGQATINGSSRDATLETNFGLKDQFSGGSLFGLNAGVFDQSGNDLLSILHAFEEDSDFELLSTAHLMSNENKSARLVVGEVIPILTGSQTTDVGAVNRSFDFEDVGIELEITPVVGEEDDVTLDISQTIAEVTSSGQELGAPTRSNREIETTVAVPDGTTLVLGGVLEARKNEDEQNVPYVSRVPLFGQLFQSESKESSRENLLVFLTPHVLSTDQELEDATNKMKKKRRKGIEAEMVPDTSGD
jgi:type II secretory pathway component GspD/PulD (secretin)